MSECREMMVSEKSDIGNSRGGFSRMILWRKK
jgi:hypothetical protein